MPRSSDGTKLCVLEVSQNFISLVLKVLSVILDIKVFASL